MTHSILTYVISFLVMSWPRLGDPPASMPHRGPNAQLLDRTLMSSESYKQDASLQEAIKLGPAAVPEIRQYLNGNGYARSLYVLSQIPEVARQSIMEALQSPHEGLRLTALELAEPYLAESDEEVISLWIGAFCSVERSLRDLAECFIVTRNMDDVHRKATVESIAECITANLPTYTDPAGATSMIYLLGCCAEQGDVAALAAIRDLVKNIDTRFTYRYFNLPISGDQTPKDKVRFACKCALANLGDRESLASFIRGMHEGTIISRERHFVLLPQFHPRSDVLRSMIDLVSDESIFYESAGAECIPAIKRRVCDAAMGAIAQWFDDCPVKKSAGWYSSAELADGTPWVINKVAALEKEELERQRHP